MSTSQVLTIQSRRQSKPLNIQPRGQEAVYGAVKQPSQQRQRSMGQQKDRISQILLNSGTSPCVFCEKFRQNQPFSIMVGRALFSKYSASQSYYYSKDINELISNQRTQVVIRVKDTAAFDEEDEYLNRYYAFHEYDGKIRRLTEYYKFHRDIARMFMLPTTTTLNKYHDKKRRIFYIQITKMLKEKEGKKDTPPPSNQPPVPQSSEKNRQQQNSNEDKEEHFQSFQLSERVLPSLDDTEMEMKSIQSNTIQDLNSRLNDILLNSTQNTQSYFFDNEASQTIGNLSSFLRHLQKQNSQASQSSNLKPDFFGQNDKLAQFKQGEQYQQASLTSSRTVASNNYEQSEPNQLILQKDSKIFAKKTSGSLIFASARSSLDMKSKQIVTAQNVNQQKIQNDDKAMQIYQMNQEMIALGILKPSSKVAQNALPHLDTEKISSHGVLSHGQSPVISPGVVQDWSPLVQHADSQMLFKKMSSNEVLASPKESKDNFNSKTKEGTIILAAKETLKSQHTFKMAVSIETTKLNSHNQSFEAHKSPLVIQHIKDDRQQEESSPIKISNTKINQYPINNQGYPPPVHSISPTKKVISIGSSQLQKNISSDKNLADANRKQDLRETNIISQENLSQQFKQHLQQRQSEEEIRAAKKKHSSSERTEIKYNPYSALNAPNTDRPQQPKQTSLQSSLTSRENREKEEFLKSSSKATSDKNNGKRLKTYEPIITRRENQIEFKASLHRSKGDPFPQQQDALGLTDRQSVLKTNEGKKLSFFNHLSSQGSLLSDEAMSPIKLQNKLSAQSEGAKSQTNLIPSSNQLRSPTLESRVIFDASPQKQSGNSLHVSKSKTTFSTAVLSQSIPSNIKLSQVGNQDNASGFEQRTTETLMSKTRRTKGNKGSISEIPEFQMSQSSSSQQNINPEITSQQNVHNSQGDTVPVRKLSNQLSQKNSLITNKFENLQELKQFYKEVQRRTEAASQQKDREDNKQTANGYSDTLNSQELQKMKLSSQRKHNRDEEVLQKGTISQRATPNTQETSNSKEISPRIQRILKQDLKSQEANMQSSFNVKQVLTERDTSNRRNSTQLKSSSSSSSTNLIPQGTTQKFPSTIGQIQTISSVQREQELNNANKILQFKQQASKNSNDNLTTSSSSTLETARKNQVAVLKSSINGGSNGVSPIPGPKQGSFTVLADTQLQQYGGQTHIVNGHQQGSSIKVMDKIKHSRINSMGSATSSYPSASSAAGIQPQSQQIKQLNQGYGQIPLQTSASQQQLQPQQFIINSNSQFTAGMPSNNSNTKKIHHKYTKSEIDYTRQGSQQNSLALSAAHLPVSYAAKSGMQTNQLNFNLPQQPQTQVQDTKRGMMSLHTQGSQQSSQSPQRGAGKKSLEQQQFFTYANNNIVNIYVNSQEGGTVIKTNNIINNYNQNVHQNIGYVINSQVNGNANVNLQQAPAHGLVPTKKQTNGVISKVRQDYLPSYSKF